MNEFKSELAGLLEIDEQEIDEIFMGCALITEAYGTDDEHGTADFGDFKVTKISFEESDEEDELTQFRKMVAEDSDVDMTAYDFFASESFTITVNDITVECRQTFSKHVQEMFTYKKGTLEIIKKDWAFSGMMSLTDYSCHTV